MLRGALVQEYIWEGKSKEDIILRSSNEMYLHAKFMSIHEAKTES
jgi:hypothetical protein